MKNRTRIVSFLMGAAAALAICCLSLPALAAGGVLTINVSPINVLVNGEVFQPKDAKGNDALVFVYKGTTYAPLRALAEAYGLEVGYDKATGTASVTDPAKAPSAGFASQWTVTEKPVTNYGSEKIFNADYSGSMNWDAFKAWWKSMDPATVQAEAEKIAAQARELVPDYDVTMHFNYGSQTIGTAFALRDGTTMSSFDMAKLWIK